MSRSLIGVDVGGSKIAAAIVSRDGRLHHPVVRPTPAAHGPSAVLDAMAEAVTALPDFRRAQGIGVGTGGVIDNARGVVASANDLLPGWAGTDVARCLGERLGLDVVVDNDVNAFAVAEQRFGAGAAARSGLYVSVGTGIGGGIVMDGRLYRGAHHTAGELGHIAVPEAVGRRCNCGRHDHLEAIAAGPAIAARYTETSGKAADLPTVAAAAAAGDACAVQAISHGAAALGRALAGIVNIIDVPCVVIGGGVADIGESYWTPLREAFSVELLPGPAGVRPVPAALGSRAAVIGAAALLLEREKSTMDEGATKRDGD